MNQELELSEQLMNEGFAPFGEIEELTKEKILDKEIFTYLFTLEPMQKIQTLAKLRDKARELKIAKSFNEMLKLYQIEYTQSLKQIGSKLIKFTDAPLENLKCGDWICEDTGVFRWITNNYTPVKVMASPHPILPVERLINVDTCTEKVKLAFFKDNKWQNVIVERNTIASKNKIIQLANAGIEVNENNAKELITYLADVINLNTQEIPVNKGITHLGWINNEFVPYTVNLKYDGDTTYKNIFESVTEKGNYEEWKTEMKKLRAGSRTLRFMMASSFASSLVKLFQINPFIVHLWGKSSNGKTVAQMICASIWGNPQKGKLLSSLDNTKVASERLCNFLRNIPLILDELQITKTKYTTYDTLIYELTEGKGRDRGTANGGLTEVTCWDNIIIISGEEPITNETSKEGVKNRVIEIEENNKLIENGNEVVNLILNNYGYAGKEFVEIIKNKDKDNLFDEYNNIVETLKKDQNSPKQINAIATILIADKIVSETIFEDNSITLEEAKDYFSKNIDETDRYINLIMDIANANINNFYDSNSTFPPSGQVWGKLEKTTDGNGAIMYYDFIPSKLYEILNENNINWNGIKRKMVDKGYVLRDLKTNEYTQNTKINGVQQRIIKIKNIYFSE